jgi:aminopeptidase-like protein
MEKSLEKYLDIIELIERNDYYINTIPHCEPQLGKRGLYPTLGSQKGMKTSLEGMMWILNLTDGEHDLIDISVRSKIDVKELYPILDKLIENKIIVRKDSN